MDRVVLFALALLAMGSLLAVITPYRIWLLAIAAIAAVALGGATWLAWSSHRFACAVLDEIRTYPLETSSFGEQTVRVSKLSLVDGFAIKFAATDGTPRAGDDLKGFGWKLRGPGGAIPLLPEQTGRWDRLADLRDDVAWIDVHYRVDPGNQALLGSVRLRVTPSNVDLESALMTSGIAFWTGWALAAATLLALAGVVVQASRRRHPQSTTTATLPS